MTDVTVQISDKAVRDLFSDWSGPVGQAIDEATAEVETVARIAAPVSPKGSVYSPPGNLKAFTRQALEHHYDDQGLVLGLVGAIRYPYNFVATPKSHLGTLNRGHRSRRRPDNYLADALNSAPFTVWGP